MLYPLSSGTTGGGTPKIVQFTSGQYLHNLVSMSNEEICPFRNACKVLDNFFTYI